VSPLVTVLSTLLLTLLLSLERSRLVFELAGTSLLLFGARRPGLLFYSLVFLPGTIIHELSHLFIAEILRVKTGQITILPELTDSKRERLGSVATASSDPIRGFLIGLAPFVSGIALLLVMGSLLRTGWDSSAPWWQLAILIYGLIVVGNSMLISQEDRRYWPAALILIFLVWFLLTQAGFQISLQPDSWLFHSLTSINLVLGVTVLLNLGMIALFYGIRLGIQKLTKRSLV